MKLSTIADNYAVSPQIQPEEVADLAQQGFVAVICNRPDGEEPGQPTAAEIAAACDAAGIAFYHIPFAAMPITAEYIAEQRRIITESNGAVLGYCRSGQRSQIIWAASA